jgi:hypothetical protein
MREGDDGAHTGGTAGLEGGVEGRRVRDPETP